MSIHQPPELETVTSTMTEQKKCETEFIFQEKVHEVEAILGHRKVCYIFS